MRMGTRNGKNSRISAARNSTVSVEINGINEIAGFNGRDATGRPTSRDRAITAPGCVGTRAWAVPVRVPALRSHRRVPSVLIRTE